MLMQKKKEITMIEDIENKSFKQLLRETIKSKDTEEWLDIYFTRPIGLMIALICRKLGIHPNGVTIFSIFVGVAGGCMFYFTDLWYNLLGVGLLMFANFLDSADGQLARLTGQKTAIGRFLDGFAENMWFLFIYMAIAFRLWNQFIPGLDDAWGVWIVVMALTAMYAHSLQCLLADYYRQIHLFFLKGKKGAELDNYQQQRALYEALPKEASFVDRFFYYNYAGYCHRQEKRTPAFQQLMATIREQYGSADALPQEIREEFLQGSRPLMPLTNILTFNVRAICLYITCLLNCPWVYLLFEITVMNALYIYMQQRHETLCTKITARMKE